jgi:subtilisin family serine protease
MMRNVGLTVLVTALTVPWGLGTAEAADRKPLPGTETHVVTLITGDQVVLADGHNPGIKAGPGRRNVAFSTKRVHGRLSVVPADAQPLVDAGRLDPRLFDITGLIAAGYDDAHSASIPVLLTRPAEQSRAVAGLAGARQLPAGITAGTVSKASAGTFLAGLRSSGARLAGGIDKVWLDGKRAVTLDQSVPQIGAPKAWAAGFDGAGVKVAVLDTGIDTTHPDLAGQVVGSQNFVDDSTGDPVGHGTHVASIIAGTAAASNGKYHGVASGARLYDGKVCAIWGCQESSILAGMQWAATDVKAQVVNLSLGGPDTPDVDPLEEAVNALTASTGALFVVAAGNSGPKAGTIESPGSADAALTVGSVDKQDGIAGDSSRGPRIGDGALKPDVTAPGVDIVAARSKDAVIGDPVGEDYLRLSGTSMATPHVAGSAAILAQQHPDWKAAELKSALMASAHTVAGQSVFDQGAGRVDVGRAIGQNVVPEPSSLSFGLAQWPHTDDKPVTKDVAFRNYGTAAVTLTLQTELTGPDGTAALAGALGVTPGSLTIPAGGTATASVTSATNHSGSDGRYSGRLTASATGVSVVLPIGLEKEAESYDLTIKNLGPDGQPFAVGNDIWAAGRDLATSVTDESGTVKLRLPKDDYTISGDQFHGDSAPYSYYGLMRPVLRLAQDTTVVLDARTARPLRSTVPQPDAASIMTVAQYNWTSPDGQRQMQGEFGALGPNVTVYTAGSGPALPAKEFTTVVSSHVARPGADGSGTDTPYLYGLMDLVPGTFPTGFQRTVKDKDLAEISQTYANTADTSFAVHTMGTRGGFTPSYPLVVLTAPRVLVEHLEAGPATWNQPVWEMVGHDTVANLQADEPWFGATYKAGQKYCQRWNAAVAGPARASVNRTTELMAVGFLTNSDADGHFGGTTVDTGASKLYRDGALVASSEAYGSIEVPGQPAERASYRFESSMTRSSIWPLSDRVDYTAAFTSAGSEESRPLPTVGYAPDVDLQNALAWKPVTVLPVTPSSAVSTIRVEFSTDGGTTWRAATLGRPDRNGTYRATFATPSTAKTVSLRTALTTTDGTAVTQTTANAYRQR